MCRARALLLLAALRAGAQAALYGINADGTFASDDEPPLGPDGAPVKVFASMLFLKLNSIDVVSATYYADFYFNIAWRDDRVAGLEDMREELIYVDAELMNAAEGNSNIDFTNINDYTVYDHPPSWLNNSLPAEARTGGWVEVYSRMSLKLDAAFDLREFPFDRQSVQVIVESKSYNSEQLVWTFTQDVAQTALPPKLTVDGWTIVSVAPEIGLYTYDAPLQTFSRLVLSINVRKPRSLPTRAPRNLRPITQASASAQKSRQTRRIPTYFVSKYVLNVCLIIVMALTIVSAHAMTLRASQTAAQTPDLRQTTPKQSYFMMPTEPDRILSSFAAYGAIVSWLFVLVSQVPVSRRGCGRSCALRATPRA